jgi:hypothetical protein
MFIAINGLSDGFGGALHLLGIYGEIGQLFQQLTAFFKTDRSPHRRHHANHAG